MKKKTFHFIIIIVSITTVFTVTRVLTKEHREKRHTEIVASLFRDNVGEEAAHFYEITKAIPDYKEIASDPGFIEYINHLPEEQSSTAKRILGSGTATEVIKLLSDYKEFKEDIKKIMEY